MPDVSGNALKERTLRIERSSGPLESLPAAPGRLMNAHEIAAEKLSGQRKPKWVLAHVPDRLKLGHVTVLWRERDVDAWIAQGCPKRARRSA